MLTLNSGLSNSQYTIQEILNILTQNSQLTFLGHWICIAKQIVSKCLADHNNRRNCLVLSFSMDLTDQCMIWYFCWVSSVCKEKDPAKHLGHHLNVLWTDADAYQMVWIQTTYRCSMLVSEQICFMLTNIALSTAVARSSRDLKTIGRTSKCA